MTNTIRIDQNNGMPPRIVKVRNKKPMPVNPIGEVVYENVSDYISVVGGKRIMFDKLTNLEVNTTNWPVIADRRGIR
ncbi:hypothetical protein [Streptococcus hyovaginalis]|uniref:hypothetical protein n=1 Tax=Streptococcus hyovaginalis TaxID=149015 RepID=UPI002A80B061|nr:hypothetical protein [Streptococcus hyovaginalis]MDY4510752.1 hypothetical protein [Streptococcus hyovaginalis]